ncbi:MAG: chloride channel protein [Dehalococcoidia bacterium]|nr:MAG: chloride channel protein [Dehalococcoidia bacterium]
MRLYEHVKSRIRRFISRLTASETAMGTTLATIVGVAAGLGAVAFRELIAAVQSLFFDGGERVFGDAGRYYVILIPVIGGLIVGLIVYYFAREAKGHGVPEVMVAVAERGGRIRPRVAVAKTLASGICIGTGGSVGREGPIVQIGSSIGSTLGQWLRLPEGWVKTLVACGAAGGISATFNAPIAGVLFAHEVILGRFISRSFGSVVISSVVADIVAHSFLGDTQSFMVPAYELLSAWEIPVYALLGIAAGFIALLFIYVLYKTEDIFDNWRFPPYLKPAVGGIFIGAIGYFYTDLFGVGYGGVENALLGNIALSTLLIMGVLKIIATSITIGSGGSGGVFAPSLFLGAMFGGAFGDAAHRLFPTFTSISGAYAVVGMAAVFAGAARAPITAIIIIFEMTRDYDIILPLMLAVAFSTVVARTLNRETIYTTKVRRAGIDLEQYQDAGLLGTITVGQAMTRDYPTVSTEMPVVELMAKLSETGHHGFPVVDEEGRLFGVVTLADIQSSIKEESTDLKVKDITTTSPIVAYPDQSIQRALLQLGARDVGRIPVVDREDRTKLLGILRRHDIINAYRKGIERSRARGRGY